MTQDVPQETPLTATLPLWAWFVVIQHLQRGIYADVTATLTLILSETDGQYAAAQRQAQLAATTEPTRPH